MSEQSTPQAAELEAALEDVRRIRSLLDDMADKNPISVIMKPMFRLGYPFAPFILVMGIFAQWIYQAPGGEYLGVSKGWLFTITALFFMIFGTVFKTLVAWRTSKKHGVRMPRIYRGVIATGYLKIIFPIFLGFGFVCVFLVKAGLGEHIAGTFLIAYGTILTAMPLALPIPELKGLGYSTIVLGGISLFMLPAYPFYKVAVVMAGISVWMGVAAGSASDSG